MSSRTFNLVRALSNLLREIDKFRKKLKVSRKPAKAFGAANARYEAAFARHREMIGMPLPKEERAHRAAEAERNRQFSKVEKLRQNNSDRWEQYTASKGFIGIFQGKLELVLRRLPLTPQWRPFPAEIRRLQLGQPAPWATMPANHDLDTLEIRLKEMIELTRGSANEARSQVPWAATDKVPPPMPGSITPGQIKATSTLEAAVDNSDKGNLALLRGTDGEFKRAVTLEVAARYGGVSRRAIQAAAYKGTLETQGKRLQRRVLVPSLRNYFPAEK